MKLVVAIVGLLTSIMAFIVSFLPPDNIQGDSTDMYVELLVVSFLVVLALPFILYAVHDRKAKRIPASLWSQSTVRTHQKVTSSCTRVHVHHTIL